MLEWEEGVVGRDMKRLWVGAGGDRAGEAARSQMQGVVHDVPWMLQFNAGVDGFQVVNHFLIKVDFISFQICYFIFRISQ